MKRFLRLALVGAMFLAGAPVWGQKVKKAVQPPGDLFFTMKGRPFALEGVVPGIQGALLLTDEQKLHLTEALDKTVRSEEVRAAGKLLKEGPDATEAQKQEAQKVIQSARTRLSELVAATLTPQQKELVRRIDAAAQEAHRIARKNLEAEFTLTKQDKSRLEDLNRQMREGARLELMRLLAGILSVDQQGGMEKAAEQQREAEQAVKKKS